MKFIADLHIHSKYSRATAKNLDLENLYIAAQMKGITVVGTGDFTHPGWFSEIKEKLVPAEEGLFKLNDDTAKICDKEIPQSCRSKVRFMLSSEISNIYKKKDKTRKNHNLVFFSDLETAARFNSKLDSIGNIKSDGRPILGLDARNLLEILLETSSNAFLIPAHIWTPWFSLLGSKSGFNSLEECFEDLTPHIFAVETGLSSDPEMNWRVSGLDGLTLVSNSDAHSPSKLGREANLFNTDLTYSNIKSAIKSGDPDHFLGTFEFYPEEGKYHFDGHRKCNVCLNPNESLIHDKKCPVCGKPLTLGVLYRVEELADRPEGEKPLKNNPFYSLVPLEEILSEILQVGPKSKRVQHQLNNLLQKLGPEFNILHHLSTSEIDETGIPLLGEAIKRMREKNIEVSPGYDGEFGKVKIFKPEEREAMFGQQSLFAMPTKKKERNTKTTRKRKNEAKAFNNSIRQYEPNASIHPDVEIKVADSFSRLNDEQKQAIMHEGSPLLIVAGPGTGKTLTLTHRIAYLIKEKGVSPENVLALTFTNKAAQEMATRLKKLIGGLTGVSPFVSTFHALCLKLLKKTETQNEDINPDGKNSGYHIIDEQDRMLLIREAVNHVKKTNDTLTLTPKKYLDLISKAKQLILSPKDDIGKIAVESGCPVSEFSLIYNKYQDMLDRERLYDYEDLIFKIVRLFESDPNLCAKYRNIYKHIFVDEYQDLNYGQYRIVRALAPQEKDICVIGDPDQSIYGFRGSDAGYFRTFIKDYPNATSIKLVRNYRSTETILQASSQVIRNQSEDIDRSPTFSRITGIKTISILELETEKSEAVAIGKLIEKMIGGMGYYSIDFGNVDDSDKKLGSLNQESGGDRGFSDIAILYRTGSQGNIFAEVFEKAGIPYQMVSKDNAYRRKGLAELISYMKIIEGSGSYSDLEKIVRLKGSGIGDSTLNAFKEWGYDNQYNLNEALTNGTRFPIQRLKKTLQTRLYTFIKNIFHLRNMVKYMPVEKKLTALKENIITVGKQIESDSKTSEAYHTLVANSELFGNNLTDFLEMIALNTDPDIYDYKIEKVTLMTMHASKGLEFPVVFVAGCEDDFIPLRRFNSDGSFDSASVDLDEERRLFYVAMTRAKEQLFLTSAKKRRIYGKEMNRTISPFMEDIENRLRKYEKHMKNKKRAQKKSDTQIQLELF